MYLKKQLEILFNYIYLFLLIVIIFSVGSLVLTKFQKTSFQSTALFSVYRIPETNTPDYNYDGFYIVQANGILAQQFVDWMASSTIQGQIIDRAVQNGADSSKLKIIKTTLKSPQSVEKQFKSTDENTAEKAAAAALSVVKEKKDSFLTATPGEENTKIGEIGVATAPTVTSKKPSMPLNFAVGAFSGIIVGFLIIYLINIFSRTVDLKRTVSKKFKEATLSEIKNDAKNISDEKLLEALRPIRDDIVAGNRRIISFLSFSQSPKNSLYPAALGELVSRAKEPSIVIDADLEKGNLAENFDKNNEPGLADFLSGKKSWPEIRQKVNDVLEVIGRGGAIHNQRDQILMLDPKDPTISEEGKTRIFHLGEFGHGTAKILSGSDSVILIVRLHETEKRTFFEAAKFLRKIEARVSVVIIG